MRKNTAALMVMMMFGCAIPGFSDWEITFGSEKSQVGLKAPKGAEDFPIGPSSYRLIEDKLWVLDSAKGAVLSFDSANKLVGEIAISGLAKEFILDDFAVQMVNGEVEAVIVVDSMSRKIMKFSKSGKELFNIQIAPEQLTQMDQIDIASDGQFYVGDFGKNQIAVFSPDGKILRTIPWQCSGFAVDKENNLHMLTYKEGVGHAHVKLAPDGKELAKNELGMPEVQNPRVWSVDANGEVLVSVVPPEGDPNSHSLLKISASGEILSKAPFKNPYYINRYLMAGKDSAWLVNADYNKADSKIKITPLK